MGRKYSEQRWTGAAAAIHYYCADLLAEKKTKSIPAGYFAGAKRFINLALDGIGPQRLIFGVDSTFEPMHCSQIATRAMIATHLAGSFDEVKDILTEFKSLLDRINTIDPKADKIILEKAATFFGQILRTGEMERYVDYVRGTDDDDD